MNSIKTFACLMFTVVMASCSKFLVLQSRVEYPWEKKYQLANRTTKKASELPAFEKIWLAGDFDVDVALGEQNSIAIEGDENLVSHFKYEVSDNELLLHYADISRGTKDKLKVIVICKSIVSVNKLGKGRMTFLNEFVADSFSIKQSGSGIAYLKLKSRQLSLKQTGSGKIYFNGSYSAINKKTSGSGKIIVNGGLLK